ncbi:hypothetical protein COCMIDRAFT_25035 [Bipolaris oryzae ATCC 44560]|uniref:Uncharacterized protein n=1 Tax=Bipolaris oryzae ATCC 44560 TaxID=930090 RepID=W6Z5D0_COCMI|nr:uncharacterized protein COCMIDRAFT_25035 [Bipolaris oryzae ATCC 44560]EUC46977.1 hypothetical protein COCMIDRAFT_25035 [Bipolaris oryzae ATCC 44560]
MLHSHLSCVGHPIVRSVCVGTLMQGIKYQLFKLSYCASAGAIKRKVLLSSKRASVDLTIGSENVYLPATIVSVSIPTKRLTRFDLAHSKNLKVSSGPSPHHLQPYHSEDEKLNPQSGAVVTNKDQAQISQFC